MGHEEYTTTKTHDRDNVKHEETLSRRSVVR